MTAFLITTDLLKPGKDYDRLYGELTRVGAKRVLLSVFIANLNQSPAQVREAIRTYVDGNDRVGVFELSDWATWNGMSAGTAILKRCLP